MNIIILISGASSRLGSFLSTNLAELGYIVYAGYRSTKIPRKNNLVPIKLDVTSDTDCRDAINDIVKTYGKLDVLINCAGITKHGKMEETELKDFDDLIEINTRGAIRLIRHVLPVMKRARSGKIINITSLSGLLAFPNYSYYSASKFALEGATQSLRYEVFKENIEVINVEPGAIQFEEKPKGTDNSVRGRYPFVAWLLPLVTPDTVAKEVQKIIESSNSPINILIGRDTKLLHFIKRMSPQILWDKMIKFFWK